MIAWQLFGEFFVVGLFSIGGGLATIPFLTHMGETTGWFTTAQLTDMIAVSESTPGPIGVNMASYVGFTVAGPAGCLIATLGLVAPSILIILLIARVLRHFRTHRWVDALFYGLRPVSTALIAAAFFPVAQATLLRGWFVPHWPSILLAAAVFAALQIPPVNKLHPVVFLALSAGVGILFGL